MPGSTSAASAREAGWKKFSWVNDVGVSMFGSWPWASRFMYSTALLKSRVELSSVVASTRVVFRGPTVKLVGGVVKLAMGVPSQ